MIKIAQRIKEIHNGISIKFLYQLTPPIEIKGDKGEATVTIDYVVCSTSFFFGLETYIFHADSQGNIMNLCELQGSQKGTSNHKQVFSDIGYEVREIVIRESTEEV